VLNKLDAGISSLDAESLSMLKDSCLHAVRYKQCGSELRAESLNAFSNRLSPEVRPIMADSSSSVHLEEQYILRLPPELAQKVSSMLRNHNKLDGITFHMGS